MIRICPISSEPDMASVWSAVCEELIARAQCTIIVDRKGAIVRLNDPEALLGNGVRVGASVWDCLGGDKALLRAAIELAAMRKTLENVDLLVSHEEAGARHYRARLLPLQGAGTQDLLALLVQDQTPLKQNELALRQAVQEIGTLRRRSSQAQRMELMGRLAGGVVHDFNNLLTAMISFSRFVMDDLAPGDPRRADLGEVLKAADSAAKLTSQLQAFSKGRELESVLIEFNSSIQRISRVLRRTLSESIDIQIIEANEPVHVMLDPGQFDQLVMNLAINARDAMAQGGKLTLTIGLQRVAGHRELSDGDYATLDVSDTGHGIAHDAMERIFEPFYSTKGERGTGLGLATCYYIAKQAMGDIVVESHPGVGSRFTVLLPLATPGDLAVALERPTNAPPDKLVGLALVVEDQAPIRRTMIRSLQSTGLNVLEASSAEEAIDVVDQLGARLDLLVTDVLLPGKTGIRLAEALRDRQPNLKVLVCSGYLGEAGETGLTFDDCTVFLAKPFTGPQLLAKARTLLLKSNPSTA